MNKQEMIIVAQKISTINKIYGVKQESDVVMYQAELFGDLDFNQVMKAFDTYVRTTKISRPPTPAQIIEIVNPKVSNRNVAVDIARKIDRAVSRYGWNWESGYYGHGGTYWLGDGKVWLSFKDAVIAELGAIGWHTVCSRGGWANVRNSSNEMDEGQFIAQMRDQIESSLSLAESGVDVSKIMMPAPSRSLAMPSMSRICDMPDDDFTKDEEMLIAMARRN